MTTIKLKKLKPDDWQVINEATKVYLHQLDILCKTMQFQRFHIYYSLLFHFRITIAKKLANIEKPKSLSLDHHAAFLLFDSLYDYERSCTSVQYAAIARRLRFLIHEYLPTYKEDVL